MHGRQIGLDLIHAPKVRDAGRKAGRVPDYRSRSTAAHQVRLRQLGRRAHIDVVQDRRDARLPLEELARDALRAVGGTGAPGLYARRGMEAEEFRHILRRQGPSVDAGLVDEAVPRAVRAGIARADHHRQPVVAVLVRGDVRRVGGAQLRVDIHFRDLARPVDAGHVDPFIRRQRLRVERAEITGAAVDADLEGGGVSDAARIVLDVEAPRPGATTAGLGDDPGVVRLTPGQEDPGRQSHFARDVQQGHIGDGDIGGGVAGKRHGRIRIAEPVRCRRDIAVDGSVQFVAAGVLGVAIEWPVADKTGGYVGLHGAGQNQAQGQTERDCRNSASTHAEPPSRIERMDERSSHRWHSQSARRGR